jgi:hypothetical protein
MAITMRQAIDAILAAVPGAPFADTVDVFKAGDPEQPVTGIATTFLATYDVIDRAAQLGANLIIAHEPVFYAHQGRRRHARPVRRDGPHPGQLHAGADDAADPGDPAVHPDVRQRGRAQRAVRDRARLRALQRAAAAAAAADLHPDPDADPDPDAHADEHAHGHEHGADDAGRIATAAPFSADTPRSPRRPEHRGGERRARRSEKSEHLARVD